MSSSSSLNSSSSTARSYTPPSDITDTSKIDVVPGEQLNPTIDMQPPSSLPVPSSLESQEQTWKVKSKLGRFISNFEKVLNFMGRIFNKPDKKMDLELFSSIFANKQMGNFHNLQNASLIHMLKHVVNFIKRDKSLAFSPEEKKEALVKLNNCMALAQDIEAIDQEQNPEKKALALEKLSAKIVGIIENLPPGQSCVIPGGYNGKQVLLYEVTKNSDGSYQMKLMSRDPNISPSASFVVGNKIKISGQTVIEGITLEEMQDKQWWSVLMGLQLNHAPNEAQSNSSSIGKLFYRFKEKIKDPATEKANYKTPCNVLKPQHLFSIIDASPEYRKSPEGQRRALHFKLNALFKFYKDFRSEIADNETVRNMLEQGVENIAHLMYKLRQENLMSDTDIEIIEYELNVVRNSLLLRN